MKSPKPRKLRKSIQNTEYPELLLRFEDGHEIRIRKGKSKSFDVWAGETIRVVAVWDPTSKERVVVATKRAEEFEDASSPFE